MKSWDCFDTLVARRFNHPHSIFKEVERISGVPNFYKERKKIEKIGNLTYSEIYKHISNVDSNLEFEIELDHCFGIVENINKVEDGDIIVSDMYLSESQIRKILEKCGLTKDVEIIVSLDGKRNGTIWSKISKPEYHVGDNYKSDVVSPERNNIKGIHYTESFFNDDEKFVSDIDYNLACWMRYIRLRFPYTSERDKSLWKDQANLNLPLLALATLELPSDKEISFCYRDCMYWHKIYSELTNKPGIRLDVSRICYSENNNIFREYVYDKTKDSLIVDLIGTGESVSNFYKGDREILYIIGIGDDMKNVKCLSPKVKNAIERHNCTTLGPLIGWDQNGPIRSTCEHDLEVAKLQETACNVAVESLKYFKFERNLDILHRLSSLMQRNYTHTNVKYVKG